MSTRAGVEAASASRPPWARVPEIGAGRRRLRPARRCEDVVGQRSMSVADSCVFHATIAVPGRPCVMAAAMRSRLSSRREAAEVKSRGTVDSEPVARLRPSPLSPWQTEQ
jgi:hypothetical protein